MKRNKNSRQVKILAASLCIFSSSLLLVYSLKAGNFSKRAKDDAGNYSDTLYMSLKSTALNPVISFSEDITSANTDTGKQEKEENKSDIANEKEDTTNTTPQFTTLSSDYYGIEYVNVLFPVENRTERMSLEDYVAGVVVSEMPASAPSEALKAQAVACRTLAVNLILSGNKSAHGGADICTSSAHCQSYSTKEQFISKYGEAGAKCYENALNATKATKGIILLYNSKPIVAAFHASSGEYTASSEEIWGGKLDYLVSVKTGESENKTYSPQVFEVKSFTRSRFIEKLKSAGVADLSKYSGTDFHLWISELERTESGRVSFIKIGDKKVSGNTVKNIFGLKSSDFSVSFSEDTITFETKGYGHGVGMSQLGAATMAESGSSFYDILKYYYPGVSFGIAGN